MEKNQLNVPGAYFFDSISSISIATYFFRIGFFVIFFERVFEANWLALAFTPFSTRPYIGVHLWPSQMWFLLLGTAIALADIFAKGLRIPQFVLKNSAPIFVVISVYFLWTFYGIALGNDAAINLFREMLYAAFCFPAVVYLARYVKVDEILSSFFMVSTIVLVFVAINYSFFRIVPILGEPGNDMLLIAVMTYSYYLINSIKKSLYVIPAFLVTLPILVNFNKPFIALILLVPIGIFFVSLMFTKKKLVSSVNIRSVKISSVFIFIFLFTIGSGFYLNRVLDGQIEKIVRETFLKERVNESGQVYFGDLSGGRLTLWTNAIELWEDRPILGNGLGTAVPIRSKTQAQIHNYYVQALMDTGLLGVSLLAGSWIIWFRRVARMMRSIEWNRKKTLYATMMSVVVGYFLFAIYGLPMLHVGAAHLFWVCVALLSNAREEVLVE